MYRAWAVAVSIDRTVLRDFISLFLNNNQFPY